MTEFMPLIGRIIMRNKHRFSTMRTPDHLLFEHNIKIFNQSIFFNISTFHALLAESGSNENNYQSKTQKKKNDSDVSGKKAEKANEKKKKAKSLTCRPEINAHDFQNKMKQMQKFLEKGATVTVKVDVTKSSEKCPESILSKIQTFVTENQISVKITKTGNVLNIFPISIDKNVSQDKDQTSKGDSKS